MLSAFELAKVPREEFEALRKPRRKKRQILRSIEDTRAMILEFLADDWKTPAEVGEYIGRTRGNANYHLNGMVAEDMLMVEPAGPNQVDGMKYRKAPPGYKPPLYPTHLDARPLASCFNGYTFLNAQQEGATAWHP